MLKRNYPGPHVHGELRGEACRNAIEDAIGMSFGHFSGQLHSVFIYAVVLFILFDSESPRQDELRQMLHRYL